MAPCMLKIQEAGVGGCFVFNSNSYSSTVLSHFAFATICASEL